MPAYIESCPVIKTVGTPVFHFKRSTAQGAWMKDPLGIMGKDSIFVMESYYRRNVVEEYEDMAKLKEGVTRKTYKLPYSWRGTGAVVYGSYLYCYRSGNILVFVNKLKYARSKYSSYFYLRRLQIDEL